MSTTACELRWRVHGGGLVRGRVGQDHHHQPDRFVAGVEARVHTHARGEAEGRGDQHLIHRRHCTRPAPGIARLRCIQNRRELHHEGELAMSTSPSTSLGIVQTGEEHLSLVKPVQVMALEMGRYGIRTNSVSPGIFKSEITERLMEKEWLGKVMRRTVPLGTFGTVNPAITSLIRYLVDDASEYVNGNDYIVDAGATLPGVPLFSSL
ncbi:hypothetical protein BHM03_00047629 [Ensete ventricosum]|nr:hypothetical protein BHM03_00047629 [Ensete ventricosum]